MTASNRFNPHLKYRKVWLFAGWILIFTIIYLTLTPSPPDLMDNISFGDKIGHFISYAVLMLWFCQLYIEFKLRLFLSLAFISMGIALEFLQGFGGVRLYEIADMFANSAGVLIGASLTYIGFGNVLHNFEKKLRVVK